jgi:hypothetical protein
MVSLKLRAKNKTVRAENPHREMNYNRKIGVIQDGLQNRWFLAYKNTFLVVIIYN